MKTNTLLTYLLYALLTGLIGVAGYKACQMKRDQARTAKENEEFQKTLRDLGYVEEDSTGSSYAGEDTTQYYSSPATTSPSPAGKTSTTTTKDGIEDEVAAPAKKQTTSTPKTSAPAGTQVKTDNTPTPSRVPSLEKESTSSSRRYSVLAGTFKNKEGARRQMETLIKMGYHNAEVSNINNKEYWVVVIKRTNSRSEADRLVDQLLAKKVDARVFDRRAQK